MKVSKTQIQSSTHLARSLPVGLIGLIGITLGALAVRHLIAHPDPVVRWAIELLVVAVASGSVVAGAYWIARSAYDAVDLWVIFGWCLAGTTAAALLGVGLYAYQLAEQASLADPEFLLESIALIGLGVGLAFGMDRRSRLRDRLESVFIGESTDPDPTRALLGLLGGEGETLRRRWDVAAAVADTTTREVPIPVLVHRLADDEAGGWPDDEAAVRSILTSEVFPTLTRNGVLRIDSTIDTVSYVGPEAAIKHLSKP